MEKEFLLGEQKAYQDILQNIIVDLQFYNDSVNVDEYKEAIDSLDNLRKSIESKLKIIEKELLKVDK